MIRSSILVAVRLKDIYCNLCNFLVSSSNPKSVNQAFYASIPLGSTGGLRLMGVDLFDDFSNETLCFSNRTGCFEMFMIPHPLSALSPSVKKSHSDALLLFRFI